MLVREIKDPRIGMVTLTGIKMSADLKSAKVYFTTLGDEEHRARALRGLNSAAGYIKTHAARRLRLRHTPDLHFEFDMTVERARVLDTLLKRTVDSE